MKKSEALFKTCATTVILFIGLAFAAPLLPGPQKALLWILGVATFVTLFAGMIAVIWEIQLYEDAHRNRKLYKD